MTARTEQASDFVRWQRLVSGMCIRCGWHRPPRGRKLCRKCARQMQDEQELNYACRD